MGQSVTRKPDFENLLKVLRRQVPDRPTLFEFFLNGPFYEKLTGKFLGVEGKDWLWGAFNPVVTEAFEAAGYDYVSVMGSQMKFDAKHSFEDVIIPVEQAYEKWGGRIAILGGIDMDFMCRSTPEQIRQRCEAILKRTAASGGYALGTGNSVPEYVPYCNYIAMIDCVRKKDPA